MLMQYEVNHVIYSMASETSSARNQKNEEQNVLLYMSTAVMKVTPQYEVYHVIETVL